MSSLKSFKFGDPITINNRLKRVEKYAPDMSSNFNMKSWQPEDNFEPKQGIYLGKRTLSNGLRSWWSDHVEYSPKEYLEVALVAHSGRINPYYSTDIEFGHKDQEADNE